MKEPAIFAAILATVLILTFVVHRLLGPWVRGEREVPGPIIRTDMKCPACGHPGCTLRFVEPEMIEVGEKKQVHKTAPMVERKCNTCGATCYEKTVLEPEKWIPK